MDPVSAISLAAAILAFVEVGGKLVSRIRAYQSGSKDPDGVLQDLATQLPLLIDIMNRIERRYHDGHLRAESEKALRKIVEGCNRQITRLNDFTNKLLPAPSDTALQRALKAVKSVRKEKEVYGSIHRTLAGYVPLLSLHFSELSEEGKPRVVKEGILYEVPPLQVARYIKREGVFKSIEDGFASLSDHTFRSKIIVLLGMGGQGKTQIALEYCRTVRTYNTHKAIFWVDASSPRSVIQSFETIIAKVDNPESAFDNDESKITFVRDIMNSWEAPWLLVFDNFDHPGCFSNISAYLPQSSYGTVLFTSRHADSERLGIIIRIDQMAEPEGLKLLLDEQGAKPADEQDAAKEIIRKLGYLPLAIDQARAYIRARRLSLAMFLNQYDERKTAVMKHVPRHWEYRKRLDDVKEEIFLSVFTTWELSFQQVGQEDDERETIGHFLTLTAFLNTSDVGENLFRHVPPSNKSFRWAQIFTSDGEWDTYKYQDILAELLSLSLLQSVSTGETGSHFSLHPLVAEWLRLRMDKIERLRYLVEAIKTLELCINEQDSEKLSLKVRQDLLSHIDACARNELESTKSTDITLGSAAVTFGKFYARWDRYPEAEAMFVRALADYEGVLGADHVTTLDAADDLGNVYRKQGKQVEAEAILKRSLTGREATLGLDHVITLGGATNLGKLYLEQGNLPEAEALFTRSLVGLGNAVGPEDPRYLVTLNDMGILYKDKGEDAKSETTLKEALRGSEKVFGPDHEMTLGVLHNLGNLYMDERRRDDAVAIFERVVGARERSLGADHTRTLSTVQTLAYVYWKQGKMDMAKEMLERALKGYSDRMGMTHSATLVTALTLCLLYWKQGQMAQAEAMYQLAKNGKEEAVALHRLVMHLVKVDHGLACWERGDLAEAEAIFEHALFDMKPTN